MTVVLLLFFFFLNLFLAFLRKLQLAFETQKNPPVSSTEDEGGFCNI